MTRYFVRTVDNRDDNVVCLRTTRGLARRGDKVCVVDEVDSVVSSLNYDIRSTVVSELFCSWTLTFMYTFRHCLP